MVVMVVAVVAKAHKVLPLRMVWGHLDRGIEVALMGFLVVQATRMLPVVVVALVV
jgi:hypothetical protein